MTTLFVTHYPGFYGANKSLLTLMCLLRDRHGVKPIVLLPSEGQMCAELEKVGISYKVSHYYWWVNYNHGAFQWLLNKRKQLRNQMRLKRLCALFKNEKIDLVYSNSLCINIGYMMAKRMRVPHIWQFRETFEQFSLSFSMPLSSSKRILSDKTNKKFVLISDYMQNSFRHYLPNDRITKVYNGVNLPKGVIRNGENVLKERLQIACVGIMCEQKNQLELLKAQNLLHKEGIEVDTWLIGASKSEYTELINDFVKENGLQGLVHCVGHTNDVFGILQDMNLGVVTAHDEAFGRVTVEFMLMRMPVVVSRSGANAELVEHGVTGEIYNIGDVEALAKAIKKYVDNPELLEKQGVEAKLKAENEFSAERNADQIYKQIEDVLKD